MNCLKFDFQIGSWSLQKEPKENWIQKTETGVSGQCEMKSESGQNNILSMCFSEDL